MNYHKPSSFYEKYLAIFSKITRNMSKYIWRNKRNIADSSSKCLRKSKPVSLPQWKGLICVMDFFLKQSTYVGFYQSLINLWFGNIKKCYLIVLWFVSTWASSNQFVHYNVIYNIQGKSKYEINSNIFEINKDISFKMSIADVKGR